MAKPRIFISSTYYDLKYVRADLERFIESLGYEPVRFEKGNIPYGKDLSPESYAYREIELCDIIVSIIWTKSAPVLSRSGFSANPFRLDFGM